MLDKKWFVCDWKPKLNKGQNIHEVDIKFKVYVCVTLLAVVFKALVASVTGSVRSGCLPVTIFPASIFSLALFLAM